MYICMHKYVYNYKNNKIIINRLEEEKYNAKQKTNKNH